MPVPTPNNGAVARIFNRIAGALELNGENVYKVRAYRNAANTLYSLPEPLWKVAADGRLAELPGFGTALQSLARETVETGTNALYESIRTEVPDGIFAILELRGLTPALVRKLWQEFGFVDLAELGAAARDGRLASLPGIGPKTAEKILAAIERGAAGHAQLRLNQATELARGIADVLAHAPEVRQVDVAGDIRRGVDTIHRLDLLATTTDPAAAIRAFLELGIVDQVEEQDAHSALVVLHNGVAARLATVSDPDCCGQALIDATGSPAHLRALARLAAERGLRLSGGRLVRGDEPIPAATEEDVYRAIGIPGIPPELREGTGEVDAAVAGALPRLLTLEDIRGDLHAHTTDSDGEATISEMATAAKALGYAYMAVTDHSSSLAITNGLTPERLRAQIRAVREAEQTAGIRIFAGSEVDIHADGTLDYDDTLLAELDFVIASAHMNNKNDIHVQTRRIVKAIENPNVDLIAHPTGRVINRRAPYPLDIEAVARAAARTGTALEINASPNRLDLPDHAARSAAQLGAWIMVNTDAHLTREYRLMPYGILTARRAWLTPAQVVNTWPLDRVEAWLAR